MAGGDLAKGSRLVFEEFSPIAGTAGVDWVGVCVLASVVVSLSGSNSIGWWLRVDCLARGDALVELSRLVVGSRCCFISL